MCSIWDTLTLSCRRFVSYRNQFVGLQSKLMNWLLYDSDLRHKRIKYTEQNKLTLGTCLILDWIRNYILSYSLINWLFCSFVDIFFICLFVCWFNYFIYFHICVQIIHIYIFIYFTDISLCFLLPILFWNIYVSLNFLFLFMHFLNVNSAFLLISTSSLYLISKIQGTALIGGQRLKKRFAYFKVTWAFYMKLQNLVLFFFPNNNK